MPHVLVDALGLLMHAVTHAADIQDWNGGVLVMATLFGLYPFLLNLYADDLECLNRKALSFPRGASTG
jgi:hypothetical protein